MKRTFHSSKPESDALNAYIKLIRASENLSVATHRHLADHDLTSSQFAVLETLYHLGPLCQIEIGKKIQKSRGNVTTVVNNLARRKLIERQKDCRDKRFSQVALTDLGEKMVYEVFPHHIAGIVRIFSCLTPAEQHELARLCRKLGLSQQAKTY